MSRHLKRVIAQFFEARFMTHFSQRKRNQNAKSTCTLLQFIIYYDINMSCNVSYLYD